PEGARRGARESGDRSMTKGITVKRQFHVRCGRSSRRLVSPGAKPTMPIGDVSRIARLMALAIRFEQLVRDGVVSDQAEISRLTHVSRARITQVLNLVCLAPDIQQQILERVSNCGTTERKLRAIAAVHCWKTQRVHWAKQIATI